jgi:type III secretory pathway lipoprotein EscJ
MAAVGKFFVMGEGMIIAHRLTWGDTRSASHFTRKRKLRSVIALCLLLLLITTSACRSATSLANVTDEGEAIEILNVLHENGIDAHKEEIGEENARQWQIVLDPSWLGGSNEVAMANQVLLDNGLPRPTDTNKKGTSESGVFEDEATRKARQLKDREVDLQKKLRVLPGVTSVQIGIVEPEDSSININPYPSTASVIIVTRDDPPNFTADTVRGLVARSVPKLNPENVYVAITTKPVRPLPWREFGAQRRHKGLDAIGIAIMIILASSVVVLLLQLRRQSNEISDLRRANEHLEQGETDQEQTTVGQPTAEPGTADAGTRALRDAPVTSALETTSQQRVAGGT